MKNVEKIVTYIFLFLFIMPNVLYFMGVNFYSDENRTFKEKPEFSIYNIEEYPAEYTSYYEDNMPFKDFLVKANAYLDVHLFHTSSEKSVIYGKDGWLFYNSKYKETTDVLDDYIGTTVMSQQELEDCKNVLLRMQAACEAEGAEFVFMVAPNKMTIYGDDYMPDSYHRMSEVSRADVLVDYLKNNTDIKVVYPKEELMQIKDEMQLYYKLDSHWNSLGGYIGYRELYNAMFGETLPEIGDVEYADAEIGSGDLARMMNVNDMTDKEYSVIYRPEITSTLKYEDKGFYSVSDNSDGKKLLMFRDSFTSSMENYITRDFASAHLKWTSIFNENAIKAENPDVVVYEIVERSISKISQIEHSFYGELSKVTTYDELKFPLNTDENIVGWCVPDQTNNSLLINGFGFVANKDSALTTANLLMVGDTVYEIPIQLEYRSDVVEQYNTYEDAGNCGIFYELNLEQMETGQYAVYIVLENEEEEHFWNLNYEIKL